VTEIAPTDPATAKRWYQRWWVWALVAFGILIVGVALSSPDDNQDQTAATTTTESGSTTTEHETTTSGGDQTTATASETTITSDTTTTVVEGTTTSAAVGDFLTFGDGSWIVGTDVQAGTYRNDDSSALCLWQRLSGFSGEFDDIIATDVTEAIAVVTIEETDAGFDAQDCGTWSTDLSPLTSSPEADFGDGTWLVGTDIAPGLWRNDDSSALCLWQRLSGFSGEFDDIIATDVTEAIATVEISSTDVGFDVQDCSTWTKIG
jgi:hypothetical protein